MIFLDFVYIIFPNVHGYIRYIIVSYTYRRNTFVWQFGRGQQQNQSTAGHTYIYVVIIEHNDDDDGASSKIVGPKISGGGIPIFKSNRRNNKKKA